MQADSRSGFGANLRWKMALGIALTGAAFAAPANATDLTLGQSSCATLDCNALTLQGDMQPYGNLDDFSGAYVIKAWAPQNGCLRLEVVAAVNGGGGSTDLEMTVVAPAGGVFRDDDGGDGTKPLVIIQNVTHTGWHTVVLHHFSGSPNVIEFQLRYGVYNASNSANCTTGTAQLSPKVARVKPIASASASASE